MINEMAGLGFNTIRLPYSSELLHTNAAPNGIDFSKNADLQGLSGIQVMDAIIAYAGQQGMRVILDHHRSGAGAGTSDNGLWYDSTYTEDAWVADWVTLANRYKTNSTVIGFERSSCWTRVMHMSLGMPSTSAEHEPHLPALQFHRTARSGACSA